MSDKHKLDHQAGPLMALPQRIAALRAKKPEYINRGQAILLQGVAASSLREQTLTETRISLSD